MSADPKFFVTRLLRAVSSPSSVKGGSVMDRFVERCAGLDVHKDSVVATIRVPGSGRERLQETQTFQTTTCGLLTLADWLASYGVTLVGMESTGCYQVH